MTTAIGAPLLTAFATDGFVRGAVKTSTGRVDIGPNEALVEILIFAPDDVLDVGVPEAIVDELEDLPSIESATVRREVTVRDARTGALDVSSYDAPRPPGNAIAGHLDMEGLDAGGAFVDLNVARSNGLRPGDVLELPSRSGGTSVPILAVIEAPNPSEHSVIISSVLFNELYGSRPNRQVIVRLNSSVERGRALAQVDRVLDASDFGELVLYRHGDLSEGARETIESQAKTLRVLQRGLVAGSFVSMASLISLSLAQRRRGLTLLRAIGMTRYQLVAMLLGETFVISVVTVCITPLFGSLLLLLILQVQPLIVGYKSPFMPNFESYAWHSGIALMVAMLAALIPALKLSWSRLGSRLGSD
jgi:hypothetical protein